MMTRKDFRAIAKILSRREGFVLMVDSFANFLENENPRFDRQRFLDAVYKGGDENDGAE